MKSIPLTQFLEDTDSFIGQLKESGKPVTLTIEGKPELVVQDAAAYQRLLDQVSRFDASSTATNRGEGPSMALARLDITLPEDFQAFLRFEVESGRYAYQEEGIATAFYLLFQELDREGAATPQSQAILEVPLEQMLAKLRRALAAKRMETGPEILDLSEAAERWEEIIAAPRPAKPSSFR